MARSDPRAGKRQSIPDAERLTNSRAQIRCAVTTFPLERPGPCAIPGSSVHGKCQIHSITPPAVDKLSFRYLGAVARRLHASWLHAVDGPALPVHEPQRAVIESSTLKPHSCTARR